MMRHVVVSIRIEVGKDTWEENYPLNLNTEKGAINLLQKLAVQSKFMGINSKTPLTDVKASICSYLDISGTIYSIPDIKISGKCAGLDAMVDGNIKDRSIAFAVAAGSRTLEATKDYIVNKFKG